VIPHTSNWPALTTPIGGRESLQSLSCTNIDCRFPHHRWANTGPQHLPLPICDVDPLAYPGLNARRQSAA